MARDDDEIGEFDLHAYADGRLERDPARRARVEAYLAERPDERARVDAYRRITQDIAAAYDPVLEEPVPARLSRVVAHGPTARFAGRLARGAAAAMLLLAVAGTGWWVGHSRLMLGTDRGVAASFERLHVTAAEAVRTGGLTAEAGQVTPELAGSGTRVRLAAPDLSGLGYSLVDRRVLRQGEKRLLQLVYRDRAGELLTVAVKGDPDAAPPPRIARGGAADVAYWRDGPLTIGVVGRSLTREVDAVAAAVNEALSDIVDPGAQDAVGPPDAAQRPAAEVTAPRLTAPPQGDAPGARESVVQ